MLILFLRRRGVSFHRLSVRPPPFWRLGVDEAVLRQQERGERERCLLSELKALQSDSWIKTDIIPVNLNRITLLL